MKNLISSLLLIEASGRLLPESMRLPNAAKWDRKAYISHSKNDNKCSCEKVELCEPVSQWPDKEIFGFGTDSDHWQYYPWDLVTSVAWADDVIVCKAHES